MASHKSALKAHRQDVKRRARNRVHRSRLRTQVKKMRSMLKGGDLAGARGTLRETISLVDRSVKYGVLHANRPLHHGLCSRS